MDSASGSDMGPGQSSWFWRDAITAVPQVIVRELQHLQYIFKVKVATVT